MNKVENKSITIDKNNLAEFQRNNHFINCIVEIKCSAKDLFIYNSKFESCSVHFLSKVQNYQWDTISFINCKFEGILDGNDFGSEDNSDGAMLKNCDFSKAQLFACRFFNVNPSELILPKWPFFSIIHPAENYSKFSKAKWTDDFGEYAEELADETEETTVITDEIHDLIKTFGGTEKELKDKLSKFDFVLM